MALLLCLGALLGPAPAGHAAATGGAPSGGDAAQAALRHDLGWPRTSVLPGGETLSIYQPQLERWDGVNLAARAAVQVDAPPPQAGAHFGAVEIEARTLTDKGKRLVSVDGVRLPKVDFPSATPAQSRAWGQAVAQALVGHAGDIALDRLEAALAVAEAREPGQSAPLRNAPPRIVFSEVPAMLVAIDGPARRLALAGTAFERVANTRALILADRSGTYYLKVFDGWMSAPALDGPYRVLAAPPASLAKAATQAGAAQPFDPLNGQTTADRPAPTLAQHAPAIVVAHAPTELIVTDGPPRLVPLPGTQLLYVENTTGNLFRDMVDGRSYLLVAGRWFRAGNAQGPWEFVPANALPAEFGAIPDDSPKENVKASIAGTAQAREAAIAATVPQTAAVKVSATRLTPPRFDGAPAWRPIEGTTLAYAANTAGAVIRVADGSFYALQNGVWFTASSVQGPWRVALSVPAAIYAIPPGSPLHYVTYVRIYAVRGDTVYEGYSPGYTGTLVDPATGVVVYGTGYAYEPWVGTVWYGAPVTYGYGAAVAYTPWTGWAVAFGLGWAWGAATVASGWGWGPYPYWGPWAYPAWGGAAWGPRGGAVAWGPGGWAGYSGNLYSQWGARGSVTRVAGGYDAWTGNRWASQVGSSYNSRTGIASAGQRGAVANVFSGNYAAGGRGVAVGPGGDIAVGSRGTAGNAYLGTQVSGNRGAVYDRATGQVTRYGAATGAGGGTVAHYGNDVYAGKDGQVYRNTGDGWQKHTPGGGWQPAAPQSPAQSQPAQHPLDAQRGAREAGEQRARQFQQSSAGMDRQWGGGAPHRGGLRGGGMMMRRR